MVLLETPWALASLFRVTRLSISMSAATSAINSGVLFLPLRIEMALIRCRFSIFNFLQDVVDLCTFNHLVTICVFDSLLNLFKALSSDSECPNKFLNRHHAAVGVGCGGLANWRAGASQSADRWAGGTETKPSPKILLFKSYFIHGTSLCTVAPDIDVVRVASIPTSYIT